MNSAAPELNFNSLWREERRPGTVRGSVWGGSVVTGDSGGPGGNGGNPGLGGHQTVIIA